MNSKRLLRAGCFLIVVIFAGGWLPRSVEAASTFSVNVAAYVDVNYAAGTNLIASPLNVANNTLSNLFSTSVLRDRLPDGSYFVSLNSASNTYGVINLFSRSNGWSNPNDVLIAPNAAALWLPSPAKITFIGEPWSTTPGPSCVSYSFGSSFSGWFPENICGVCGISDPCPPPYPDGTTISKWNTSGQGYDTYEYFENFGSPTWLPSTPQIDAPESFLISAPNAFTARSPFFGTAGGGSALQPGRPFGVLRDAQRSGTNLTFRFTATNGTLYSLLWTTNLKSGVWQILPQSLGGTGGGFATNTVPMINKFALFKVHPLYTGPNPILVPRVSGRGTASFSFDFYAPTGTTYQIDRVLNLNASPVAWTNIANVAAGSNTLVNFTDTSATAARGYYRVRY